MKDSKATSYYLHIVSNPWTETFCNWWGDIFSAEFDTEFLYIHTCVKADAVVTSHNYINFF